MASLRHELAAMHTYGRPHGSPMERAFLDRYVRPLGATEDGFGNWHLAIGDAPTVLWSCHTDTVHRSPCRQTVHLDPLTGILSLSKRSRRTSSCLGADDTVGVFLMRHMILAGVPGYYVFHYGEEAGCLGSQSLADHGFDALSSIKMAIAFDRRDTGDVITHQCGLRTCSDAFATGLASALNLTEGLQYRPSANGLFTDTESYASLIPECTNLSVGYSDAHRSGESVDTDHVLRLLSALLTLDVSTLTVDRDPSVRESRWQTMIGDWRRIDDDTKPNPHGWQPSIETCEYCGTQYVATNLRHSPYCSVDCEEDDLRLIRQRWELDSRATDTDSSTYLDPDWAAVQDALRRKGYDII